MSESVESDMIELDAQGRKLQEVLEFWLVSAPGNPTCQNTFDALQTVVGKSGHLGNVFKFPIPELKVFIHVSCSLLHRIYFFIECISCSFIVLIRTIVFRRRLKLDNIV